MTLKIVIWGEKMRFIYLCVGALLMIFFLSGCDGATGRVSAVCPQYQCIKTMAEAQYKDDAIKLSGKGPTILPGTVNPKVKITNPNDEPATFKVVFSCENKYKSTSEIIETPGTWLEPGTSKIFQGDFRVGVKENWVCSYEVAASTINNCELQQIWP